MDYFKGVLGALAALILAELVPGSWSLLSGISTEKATGLAAVTAGLVESIVSPLFWVLTISFFALFLAASRAGNKLLRIFLFWIPTLTVSSISIAIVSLCIYLFMPFRNP
jgi:hypothetical protein